MAVGSGVPSHGLEATDEAAGAGDPRPAARDVRAAGQRAARPPDRRADQDRPLPAHQRPQPGPRLRARCASASRPGRRSATRRSRRSRRRSGPAAWAGRRRRGSRRSSSGSASRPTSTGPRTAPREESLEFLLDLPGVGRKTAACVLIFTWGIPEIPVDVHIHRVGGRLGLFPEGASFERAHDEMLAIVDPEDAYELHMNLIRHGREICRPKPRCGECELRRMCPWYRAGRAANEQRRPSSSSGCWSSSSRS